MSGLRRILVAILLWSGGLCSAAPGWAAPASEAVPPTDVCPEFEAPRSPRDCECLLAPSRSAEESRDRARQLDRRVAAAPSDPWWRMALALHWLELPGDRAFEAASQAREQFRARADRRGEAYAEALLIRHHQRRRQDDSVQAGLARLQSLRSGLDDPVIDAWAVRLEAHDASRAARVDTAYLALHALLTDERGRRLPPRLRSMMLSQLSQQALRLGFWSEALIFRRESTEACGNTAACETGHRRFAAQVARGMAIHGLTSREHAYEATLRAYRDAVASGSRWSEMAEVCELGQWVDPPEALKWFRACEALATQLRCDDIRVTAGMLCTVGLARDDPSRLPAASQQMQAFADEAAALGLPAEEMAGYGFLSQLERRRGRHQAMLEAMRQAVRIAEELQARQRDPESRSATIANSAQHYYNLARALALPYIEGAAIDLAKAHSVMERFRLHSSEAEIARLHRGQPGEGLATAPATAEAPHDADLPTLQSMLAEDEALLAYQTGSAKGDRPWGLVVTASKVTAVDLPEAEIEAALGLYLGMLQRRDGSEAGASKRLSQALVQPMLEPLDPPIRRLVVIPDGRLYQLPLGALPTTGEGMALIEQYEMDWVVSARQFVELRQRPNEALPRRAIALSGAEAGDLDADAPLIATAWRDSGVERRLLAADTEARDVVRAIGRSSLALIGDGANEGAWVEANPETFGVLHIAAHAVSNHAVPARSALFVGASRDRGDDGLLHPSEIQRLDLKRSLVVLSACDSARGQDRRGRGPLSLTRAFLDAGSPAVIGTLWPVRDEEAAAFSEAFYRHLTAGRGASAALAAAQREFVATGAPAASWSAFVLFGDGRVELEASLTSVGPLGGRASWWLLAGLLLLSFGIWASRQR